MWLSVDGNLCGLMASRACALLYCECYDLKQLSDWLLFHVHRLHEPSVIKIIVFISENMRNKCQVLEAINDSYLEKVPFGRVSPPDSLNSFTAIEQMKFCYANMHDFTTIDRRDHEWT